jgi:hypothetical protein
VGTRWSFLVVATVFLILNCFVAYGEEAKYVPEYEHYENLEFLFSFDYPKGWLLEEVNPVPLEIGIKPQDSKYNQIQITVYNAWPLMRGFDDSFVAGSMEAGLQEFFDSVGASNLNILVNERATGMWDWNVSFTVTYPYTPLQGGVLTNEKYISDEECTVYSLFYMYSGDWPEGLKVIDSFTING